MINKRRMLIAVLDFLLQNLTKLTPIPALTPLIESLRDIVARIGDTHEAQLSTSVGQTQTKEELKQKSIISLLEIIKRAKAYALISNDLLLKSEIDFSASELQMMPQDNLTDAGNKIIAACTSKVAAMAEYGITTAMLETATANLAEYKAALPGVKRVIASRKTATGELDELFAQADLTIKKIDALMEIAGMDDAHLLQEYKNLRVISDLKGKGTTPDSPADAVTEPAK